MRGYQRDRWRLPGAAREIARRSNRHEQILRLGAGRQSASALSAARASRQGQDPPACHRQMLPPSAARYRAVTPNGEQAPDLPFS
jgi:hypothetical protein